MSSRAPCSPSRSTAHSRRCGATRIRDNGPVIQRIRGLLVSPLIDAVEDYRAVLKEARQKAEPVTFDWYPYDSLGNMVHLEQLLEHSEFDFKAAVAGKTILDLGCADGDFAFF